MSADPARTIPKTTCVGVLVLELGRADETKYGGPAPNIFECRDGSNPILNILGNVSIPPAWCEINTRPPTYTVVHSEPSYEKEILNVP